MTAKNGSSVNLLLGHGECTPKRLPGDPANALTRRAKSSLQKTAARLLRTWPKVNTTSRVVVLCYHSVHPKKRFATRPIVFKQHLSWLKANSEVIRFSEIFPALGRPTPNRPAVAITFDDGYHDNFEYAFPLLQDYGLTATFFVTTGLTEGDSATINRFRLIRRSADDVSPMSWFDLKQMIAGGMDVGAHTHSHPKLSALAWRRVWTELTLSKNLIEQRLGCPVTTMAYPYGKPHRHWNSDVLRLAADAGYRMAAAVLFRNVRHSDCFLSIPRIAVTNDTTDTLRDKISGAWDFVGLWQEHCPLWLARLTSPRDFRPVPGLDSPFLLEY